MQQFHVNARHISKYQNSLVQSLAVVTRPIIQKASAVPCQTENHRERVRWRNADTVARDVLTGTSVETAPLSVLARGLTINRSVRISRGQGEGNRDNAC